MSLLSVHTPIIVIGRDICAGLRPYFERIHYGPETVAYCETQAEGRAQIREGSPAVVIVYVPCGPSQCLSFQRIAREAREANEAAHLVAVVDDPASWSCPGVDVVLPWPVSYEEFTEQLHSVIWKFAVAERTGFRSGAPSEDRA